MNTIKLQPYLHHKLQSEKNLEIFLTLKLTLTIIYPIVLYLHPQSYLIACYSTHTILLSI